MILNKYICIHYIVIKNNLALIQNMKILNRFYILPGNMDGCFETCVLPFKTREEKTPNMGIKVFIFS